jgi:hypothetical protein
MLSALPPATAATWIVRNVEQDDFDEVTRDLIATALGSRPMIVSGPGGRGNPRFPDRLCLRPKPWPGR